MNQLIPRNRTILGNSLFDWALDDFFRLPQAWEDQANTLRGLATDIYETNDDVVVRIAAPGVNPDEVSIQVSGDTLTISGQSQQSDEVDGAVYLQRQLQNGRFTQMITLPTAIQAEKAAADYSHGILTLTMPKADEVKPKTIKIRTNGNSQKLLK